jgi:glutathione peroxidase
VNYEQLALLQEKFQSRGFSVLAFPTNDFHQELSTNEEIRDFVESNFEQVTFPIFGLSSLRENPVYQSLQKQLPDAHVQHNFFKYLVDRNGKAVKMFHKKEDPITLTEEIERLLDQGDGPKHKLVTA